MFMFVKKTSMLNPESFGCINCQAQVAEDLLLLQSGADAFD